MCFLLLGEFSLNHAVSSCIHGVDQACFFKHDVGYSVARDQAAELLDRERLLHQFLDVFTKNVVEPADTIRGQNLEREWQLLSVDRLGLFQSKPGRRKNLLTDSSQLAPVGIRIVFERIDLQLQLADQLIEQVVSAAGDAGTHQVGDDADLIPTRLESNEFEG